MNATSAYSRTQNQTASKERLMVLLFEAALKHIRAGAAALEQGQRAPAVTALTKANDIVTELSATLDVSKAPDELGQTLLDLYVFVSTRLITASATLDAKAAREAERVFAPIADAFSTAVAQLGSAAP